MSSENVQGVSVAFGRYLNRVGETYDIETAKQHYSSSMTKKMRIKYEFAVSFGKTIVMPYRAITTEATYIGDGSQCLKDCWQDTKQSCFFYKGKLPPGR